MPHRLPLTARARFAPTAGVVLFRGAAALHAHGGKGEGQEIRAERGGAALTGIGDVLPAGDIQPAAAAVLFGSGIELHIAPAVPQLRIVKRMHLPRPVSGYRRCAAYIYVDVPCRAVLWHFAALAAGSR